MTATELQHQRRTLGYSVSVMAEVLGIDAKRLQAWERGDEAIPEDAYLEAAFVALRRTRGREWPSLLASGDDYRA